MFTYLSSEDLHGIVRRCGRHVVAKLKGWGKGRYGQWEMGWGLRQVEKNKKCIEPLDVTAVVPHDDKEDFTLSYCKQIEY